MIFRSSDIISRLEKLSRVVAFATLITIYLSQAAWSLDREIPIVAAFDFLQVHSSFVHQFFFYLIILACVGLLWKPRNSFFSYLYTAAFLFSFALDILRLQTFFYFWVLLIVGSNLSRSSLSAITNGRICIVFLYIWAAVQKINLNFLQNTFPFFFQGFGIQLDQQTLMILAGVSIFFEFLVGILLLTRWHRVGLLLAVVMHLFILLSIGPFGLNWDPTVWPWNMSQIILCLLLFMEDKLNWRDIISLEKLSTNLVKVLVIVMPLFNFFGLWGDTVSFHLYSGSSMRADLFIDPKYFDKNFQTQFAKNPQTGGYSWIAWSTFDNGLNMYPNHRYFSKAFYQLCKKEDFLSYDPKLLVMEPPLRLSGKIKPVFLTCAQTP